MAVDLGDVIRLNFTNLSPAGAPVTAGVMGVTVTLPDLTTTVVTPVTPDTTGVYHYDYQTVQPGRHSVRWLGTGANPGAHADVFDVRPASPPYLVSLSDAKQQLNMKATGDDEELRKVVESATAAVERHLDMAVIRRTVVEKRNLGNPGVSRNPGVLQTFTVTKKPVISLTSVVAADGGLTWNVANMRATDAGVVEVLNGAVVWGPVVLTYVAGLAEIPANYTEAAEIIIQHLWDTQRGSKGGAHVGGLDTPGAGFTSFGFAIPNRAMELLGPPVSGIA
jgi:hypothetical protein